MKKAIVSVLLAVLAVGMAACGTGKENAAVTEDSDPARITSEKVDRAGWTSAFETEPNFSLKSVIHIDMTQDGTPMSETVTYVYRFTADKMHLTMAMAEGGKQLYEAEGYLEIAGNDVSFWQRTKESGEKEWSEWDGEEYEKKDLPEIFSMTKGLSFAEDNYANFSYSDAEKGYLATTSGLAEMQEELNAYVGGLLAGVGDGIEDLDLSKLVLKFHDGKPSACLLAFEIARAEARGNLDRRESENDDTMPEDEGNETQPETPGQGTDPETPGQGTDPETPGQGTDPETPGQGGTQPETPAPAQGGVEVTQLYFDYGTTAVTRPADLPALNEEPAPTRMVV